MEPFTISGINRLPEEKRRQVYSRLIPPELLRRFQLPTNFLDSQGRDLLVITGQEGSAATEMSLTHKFGFPDPILYGHITDTLSYHVHILLYVLNDPTSPRFDVDRLPDGTSTQFGTQVRNLAAEIAAMQFGLAPGQIRRGLRLLGQAIGAFEQFIESLGHELYFAEPLYYHNALIFERYGFAYEKGRRLMERIQAGFAENGDLRKRLDGSTPFRQPETIQSIRLRSWAIHDGLLGEPYNHVTMYKRIGKIAGVNTCPDCRW